MTSDNENVLNLINECCEKEAEYFKIQLLSERCPEQTLKLVEARFNMDIGSTQTSHSEEDIENTGLSYYSFDARMLTSK